LKLNNGNEIIKSLQNKIGRFISSPTYPNFAHIDQISYYWTSTERIHVQPIWVRALGSSWADIMRFGEYKENGFSVRCVKD